MSDGETIEEAIKNGEDAFNSWMETKIITLTMKDIENGLNKTLIYIGYSINSHYCCLNITTPKEVFGCELITYNLDKSPYAIGGELTIENIKQLHAFLTDLLGYYD